MTWNRKDLLGVEDLTRKEIEVLFEKAFYFCKTVGARRALPLQGITVANLFFESSTRTRTSFEIAAKKLGADVINISEKGSAMEKGESLLDTAKTLEAMGVDIFVIRHAQSGVPHFLASHMQSSVINAGDGAHEHPTQALLDAASLIQKFKKLNGLKLAIIGDIAHSRVARSNIFLLNKLGVEITVCGPAPLVPKNIKELGVKVSYSLPDIVSQMDVLMSLRIQKERLSSPEFPNLNEYAKHFGLNKKNLQNAKKSVVLMHPGPINWGVDMDPDTAFGTRSLVLDQVKMGVAVRMGVLSLLGAKK